MYYYYKFYTYICNNTFYDLGDEQLLLYLNLIYLFFEIMYYLLTHRNGKE